MRDEKEPPVNLSTLTTGKFFSTPLNEVQQKLSKARLGRKSFD